MDICTRTSNKKLSAGTAEATEYGGQMHGVADGADMRGDLRDAAQRRRATRSGSPIVEGGATGRANAQGARLGRVDPGASGPPVAAQAG